MRNSLLPEAIRGSWYLLADDDKPLADAIEKKGQLLTLHLTGKFSRYELSTEDGATAKVEKDSGDYTFDGDFLILRGNNTETYRVRVDQDWCWSLEAKKKKRKIVRGNLLKADFIALDADEIAELNKHSHRVKVETAFANKYNAIFELVFQPKASRRLRIGCFSVDIDPNNNELWLGLTPLVTNLSADLWQQIVAQSCGDLVRANPAKIERVLLDIQGQDALREIEVS